MKTTNKNERKKAEKKAKTKSLYEPLSKIKNSSYLGDYFLVGAPFFEQKNENNTNKSSLSGPTQIATGEMTSPNLIPMVSRGLQRNLCAHPLDSAVAPGAHSIQRSRIGP